MEKMLGVMLDCSRNAVIEKETVKNYANILKKMGYNTLMLYTEDTYEVDNQPFFGHLRGKYSKSELKEMDKYCVSIGIELIPCIQTLAHLENVFKWESEYETIKDCDNILLIGEEKTYKLIEDMLSTLSQCFSSRKIHIGMDEAYRVGTGKYQELNGIKDRFDIINEHLHRVCEIAKKFGLEPMIWSDMFCKLALDIQDQYEYTDASKILEKAKLPEEVCLVYWDYYSTDYNRYEKMIKTNKMFGRKVYFAGGAWSWRGFAPLNSYSMQITDAAFRACNDLEVEGMFLTAWGDNGAECSKYAILPSLMYAAELAKGNTDVDNIKKKFFQITGCQFDTFMLLDKLNAPGGMHTDAAAKYLLYNDIFMGIRDFMCTDADCEYYNSLACEIHNADGKGDFSYLFDSYEKLARVLAIKSNLGNKIRNAYLNNDKEKLNKIVTDCNVLIEKLIEFHVAYQKAWFAENKPHGFDVFDIRLGGLIQRIKSCKTRLNQFVCGEINEIPELEEPVMCQKNGLDWWERIASPNQICGL